MQMGYIEDENKLHKFYDMGVTDNKGEYIPYNPDDPNEMK